MLDEDLIWDVFPTILQNPSQDLSFANIEYSIPSANQLTNEKEPDRLIPIRNQEMDQPNRQSQTKIDQLAPENYNNQPYYGRKIQLQLSDIFIKILYQSRKKIQCIKNILRDSLVRRIIKNIKKNRSRFSYGAIIPILSKMVTQGVLEQVIDQIRDTLIDETMKSCDRLEKRTWKNYQIQELKEAVEMIVENLKRCRDVKDLAFVFKRRRWNGWFKKQITK